jgi:hypothetical protein
MSTFWVNFLTPARHAISNSRGCRDNRHVHDASAMEVVLRKPEINPAGRRRHKLDAMSALMITQHLRNNPITNEALIHLGASDRKDLDAGSAAPCKIVESDT